MTYFHTKIEFDKLIRDTEINTLNVASLLLYQIKLLLIKLLNIIIYLLCLLI